MSTEGESNDPHCVNYDTEDSRLLESCYSPRWYKVTGGSYTGPKSGNFFFFKEEEVDWSPMNKGPSEGSKHKLVINSITMTPQSQLIQWSEFYSMIV